MKKICYITILLLCFVLTASACGSAESGKNGKSENRDIINTNISQASDDYMTEEEYHDVEASNEMQNSIADEKTTDAGNYDAMEQVRGFGRYDMERIEYQADWQCHFWVYIDKLSSDWEVYRNIDAENMTDEEGQIPLGYQQIAYLADIIVDKYIREYGGTDVKYTV